MMTPGKQLLKFVKENMLSKDEKRNYQELILVSYGKIEVEFAHASTFKRFDYTHNNCFQRQVRFIDSALPGFLLFDRQWVGRPGQ